MHRNVPSTKTVGNGISKFSLKVTYWTLKVKLRNLLETALITFDGHHIHIVGRYRQGQHTLLISRSKSRSQRSFSFFAIFAISAQLPRSKIQIGLLSIWDRKLLSVE